MNPEQVADLALALIKAELPGWSQSLSAVELIVRECISRAVTQVSINADSVTIIDRRSSDEGDEK